MNGSAKFYAICSVIPGVGIGFAKRVKKTGIYN